MASRISGVCYCKIDGDMLDLEGSITVTPGDVTREMVATSTGVIGYSETTHVPQIELTAYLTKSQVQTLMSNTDMTITAEMANGDVFTLSEAIVSGEISMDAQAGTTSVTFQGVRGEFI